MALSCLSQLFPRSGRTKETNRFFVITRVAQANADENSSNFYELKLPRLEPFLHSGLWDSGFRQTLHWSLLVPGRRSCPRKFPFLLEISHCLSRCCPGKMFQLRNWNVFTSHTIATLTRQETSQNSVGAITSRWMRWVGHVARINRTVCRILW